MVSKNDYLRNNNRRANLCSVNTLINKNFMNNTIYSPVINNGS